MGDFAGCFASPWPVMGLTVGRRAHKNQGMITGVHAMIYAKDVERVRNFFRDVLEFPFVDAGRGWLIFALPPAEVAAHPADGEEFHELYLMCDDVEATVAKMKAKGVTFTQPVADRGWGLVTQFEVPGGGLMGMYQPRHPNMVTHTA